MSALRPWLLGVCGTLALAGGAALWFQGRELETLRMQNDALRADRDQAIAVNRANAAAVEKAKAEAFLAAMALAARDGETGRLAADNAALQAKLREAANHETHLDRVVHPGVADALCLQYAAASGHAVRDHTGHAAGRALAGADHTAAGRGDGRAANCAAWRRLTYRDLVEWNGDLLRHAGLERADKAALRGWVTGPDHPRKTQDSASGEVLR